MRSKRVPLILARNIFILLAALIYLGFVNVIGLFSESFVFFFDQSLGCGINSGMGNTCFFWPFPFLFILGFLLVFFGVSLVIDFDGRKQLYKFKYLILAGISCLSLMLLFVLSPIVWIHHIVLLLIVAVFLFLPSVGLLLFLHLVRR